MVTLLFFYQGKQEWKQLTELPGQILQGSQLARVGAVFLHGKVHDLARYKEY